MTAAACLPDEKLPCHPVIAPGMPLVFVIRNCEALCYVSSDHSDNNDSNRHIIYGVNECCSRLFSVHS